MYIIMALNPALIASLFDVAAQAKAAAHGDKSAVYAAAAQRLGMSPATLFRKLKEATVQPVRKQRNDAGSSHLSYSDLQHLSANLMEGYRANNKKIISIDLALTRLRANHPDFASYIDAATGEIRYLSASACTRALLAKGLHPRQLTRDAVAQSLRSEHPNDVWQIDASLSTLFYVPGNAPVQDMDPAEFYKNKPQNFERIKRDRLTRYCITDHCSGSIFVHYVGGGESIANMAESFLVAIQQRPEQQMYGVPFYLMMDPGSAGTAGAFGNLLRRLQVEPIVNKAGNARAKGQVEKAHDLVECDFESGFKLTVVPSLDWINAQAQRWMRYFNSVKTHSRHDKTRWDKWREITPSQLRLPYSPELCREFLTHDPEGRVVDQHNRISFNSRTYSVQDVPGVMVGEKLKITHNLYNPSSAYVLLHGADGHEQLIEIPEVTKDEHGFFAGAAHIGREFKSPADTLLETNRKAIERLAMQADTDAQAAVARKAKTLPFGGALDPYKHHDDLPDVAVLPRKGVAMASTVTTRNTPVPVRTLSQFEIAQALVARGLTMTPELVATLRSLHPEGAPEDQINAIHARLTVRGGLRVVAGGAV